MFKWNLFPKSCLHNVNNIIAQLLVLVDKVGENGAGGVVVLVVIDGADVLDCNRIVTILIKYLKRWAVAHEMWDLIRNFAGNN